MWLNSDHPFIVTKEHRRFSEFANAVRKYRYIGLCYGPAGVGKTLSARQYANWNLSEYLLSTWGLRYPSDAEVYKALAQSRTVFHTPNVTESLRDASAKISLLISRVGICIVQAKAVPIDSHCSEELVELLIIDASERLTVKALEYIRDLFDRTNIGVIFIGMPGMEKTIARYPQLYSRVGFAHNYRPLQGDELSFVLTNHWKNIGLNLDFADFTDSQAVASIARITGGNFRLLHRLFVQIERILQINDLSVITNDVVEAPRSTLVIGGAI